MSGFKHTPAPWFCDGAPENVRIEGHYKGSGHGHLVLVERVGGRRYGENYSDLSEVVANAKLIRSSPELLKALVEILTQCDPNSRIWRIAQKAIASATE